MISRKYKDMNPQRKLRIYPFFNIRSCSLSSSLLSLYLILIEFLIKSLVASSPLTEKWIQFSKKLLLTLNFQVLLKNWAISFISVYFSSVFKKFPSFFVFKQKFKLKHPKLKNILTYYLFNQKLKQFFYFPALKIIKTKMKIFNCFCKLQRKYFPTIFC